VKEQAAPPAIGSDRELAASSTYFDSEAHYKAVAAAIRAACGGASGYVLVTGDPAPSGLPLARALGVEGTQRCDICVIACRPELSFAALVTAYAARWGIAVAEAEARQQWRRIATLMRPRGGSIYVLVLEHAEQLDDAVLDELVASGDRQAPVVLIGSEALAQRLETPSMGRVKSAIAARVRFRELARNEIEAFIRFQLSNAGGTGRDVFTARVVELIAAQASGDPAAVDRLTEAIADAARGLGSGVLAGLRMRALKQNAAGTELDLGLELATASSTRVPPASASPEPLETVAHGDPPPLRRLQSILADDRRAGSARTGAPSLATPTPRRERARPLSDEASRRPLRPSRPAAMAGLLILGVAALSVGVTLYPDSPREVWDWGQGAWADLRSTEIAPPMQRSPHIEALPRPPAAPPPNDPVPSLTEPGPTVVAAPALPAPTPTPATPPETAVAALPPAAERPTAAEAREAASIGLAAPRAAAEPAPGAAGSSNEPVMARADAEPAAAATGETTATPIEQPAAAAPAPPERHAAATTGVPSADLVTLVWRGDRLLAAGEIVAARHFFERAAASGDAGAACGAGKSYDPIFLKQLGVRGVAADPAKAVAWYRKAAAAGSAEAPALLERLLAAMPS
jgi:type II secretory pathway predicted ATPase ExeA